MYIYMVTLYVNVYTHRERDGREKGGWENRRKLRRYIWRRGSRKVANR